MFVKRKIPIRFGIVPLAASVAAIDQAKVAYHLLDTYGLSAVFTYLENVSCLLTLVPLHLQASSMTDGSHSLQ